MRKVIDELIEHKKIFDELVEVQTNSNLELQGIAQDISDISNKLDNFTKLSASINKSDELVRKDESAKEEEKRKSSENKSIYELRKIREAVLDSAKSDVADKAQQDPAFHTFATRMDAVKEMFGDMKDSFRDRDTGKIGVGSTLKGMARGVATSFSANARNREEFIKTQKGLGSTRSEKVLKQQYKDQQALLYRNNKNERRMNDARGNLSKEEFLKGGSKKAQEYLKEKTTIGAGLSQVDERYKIKNPEKTDREKDADFFGVGKGVMSRPKPKPDESPVEPTSTESPVEPISVPTPPTVDNDSITEFSSIVSSLKEVIGKLSDSIEPMTKSDVSTEDKLEAQRSTNEFQKNQLDLMGKQNKVLDDSLKVHNLILEELKKRTEEIAKKADENKNPLDELKDVAENKLKDALENRKDKGERNKRPKPTRDNSRKRRMGKKGLFGLGAAAAGVGAAEAMDVIDIIPDTPNRTTTVPEDPKTGDIKPGDNKPGDNKPGDNKPGDSKPTTTETPNRTTTVPEDPKTGDIKPGDSKPTTPETPKKTGFFDKAKSAFKKIPGVSAAGDVGSKITESIAKRLPKAALKATAKSIPGIGLLVGAGGALAALSNGDVAAAGLEAVSGMGSAITAIPATAALLAKEVYEDVYGIKPEDDPEAGTRLTEIKDKVVLELQKVIGMEDVKPSADVKSESGAPLEALSKTSNQQNNVTPESTGPTSEVKPEAVTPESTGPTSTGVEPSANVTPESTGPTSEVKPEAVTPEKNQPGIAKAVYDKSAEVAPVSGGSSTIVNNISAPTNNVTAPNTSAPTKFEPRNNDSTVNRLFANRQFY